jgi:hypothetical protein
MTRLFTLENHAAAKCWNVKAIVWSLAAICIVLFYNAGSFAADGIPPIQRGSSWNPAQSDQWVATDDLGRTLPDYQTVGATRPDKFVACFYFLWLGRHGEAGPYNISEILREYPDAINHPEAPYWGELYAPHHWAESIFGYYVGEDESVLRKHAQMLGDAGVDVICFDVTNQLTYPESYRPLFKVFSEMQKEGNKVPKVAFLCPFGAPDKVVRELWRDVYSKDFYSDIWFSWKGKPLILADPDLLSRTTRLDSTDCFPVRLEDKSVLAQTFSVAASFNAITLNSPTWRTENSAVNFKLRDESGKALYSSEDVKVSDNVVYSFSFEQPMPAGVYTAELSKAEGTDVGWWARSVDENNYSESSGKALPIDDVTWLSATANGEPIDKVFLIDVGNRDEELEQILNFFTFRPPQPSYFIGQTKVNQWSWLEAYPQHAFYNDKGEIEQMAVGVAQNAVDGQLGVLSNPRAYGRSFHNGEEPASEDCDYSGKNFQEQWERALEVDPEIVFITGWNEWIAGRFDANAPFHGATPVSFVDQFNEEFSRDCEPMKGGHGDAYYYQMIANIRRFKGVSPPERAKTADITIDGLFSDWENVAPRFYDTIADPVHRNCRGWGSDQIYINNTGRNDFVKSRVSFDKENLYFYVETKDAIQGNPASENWIALLLDTDEDSATGVNGADFIVRPSRDNEGLELVAGTVKDGRNTIDYSSATPIEYRIAGKQLELKIPLSSLPVNAKKPVFRFKWTDGIDILGDWSGFTTDGDAAPNDRYFYRYIAP